MKPLTPPSAVSPVGVSHRALIIFRCAGDDAFYSAHASQLPPMTRELVEFMRACGACSSWGWHAESREAYEVARSLVKASAGEVLRTQQSEVGWKRRAA